MLKEIHQQPEHIRKIFMWTLVVISFLFVSFFWFRSTSRQVVALLNPEKIQTEPNSDAVADAQPVKTLPFETLRRSFRELTANLRDLINIKDLGVVNVQNDAQQSAQPSVVPQSLPVTE